MNPLINSKIPKFKTLISIELNAKYNESIKLSKSHQDDIQSFLSNQLPNNTKFKIKLIFDDGECEMDCSNLKFKTDY